MVGVVLDLIPYFKKQRETDYVFIPQEFIETWRNASPDGRQEIQQIIDIKYIKNPKLLNMTNWILNGQKGDYDWNHNAEYKKCPYCGSNNNKGAFGPGHWEKGYECKSTIKADWSNDGYTINYEIKCDTKEGRYNDTPVCGRVMI
jgi:hypothetical protein